MDDSEIIGGFEALFGAMSAEQQTRINAYLAARVGPAPATCAQPPKTLPSADDVVEWLNAQAGQLPDAVMNAISAATVRHIKAKFPPAAVPSSPPYDFLRNIPPPRTDWEGTRRLLDDAFRRTTDHTEPHGFGKQWVGTTTGPNALAQQPPATRTQGGFNAAARPYELMGMGASYQDTDSRLVDISADYSQNVGPIGGVFR